MITEKTIDVGNQTIGTGKIHVAEAGSSSNPAVLFLHGWPENWRAYEQVMELAAEKYHAIAIDLPGIGHSIYDNAPFLKSEIAAVVHQVITRLDLHEVTLVGHDVGGQVAFAFLQLYPDRLKAAAILDVVIPGVPPWDEVLRNPYIWHFAFHAIPDLPETVVQGKQRAYFDYFYNVITAHPERITAELKEKYAAAYASPSALSTGFNWYRGFREDAKFNKKLIGSGREIETPVLYLRGEKSRGVMETYANGLISTGLRKLTTGWIHDCGHFMAEERPNLLWETLEDFLG